MTRNSSVWLSKTQNTVTVVKDLLCSHTLDIVTNAFAKC